MDSNNSSYITTTMRCSAESSVCRSVTDLLVQRDHL